MAKPSTSLHAPSERRSAIWPYLLMPLAALAIFLALRGVRNYEASPAATASQTARSAADQ